MLLNLERVQKQYGSFALDVSLRVEAGECEVFGKPVAQLSTADRAKIGVVLSDSGFSGYLTVQDIVPVMNAMYTEFSETDFWEKCTRFQIPFNKKIMEFSTGMKAKLKVLLALSHGAKLLILDEPTAGLDVVARGEVLDMLREYMEDGTKGILISSHISSDLEEFCDELYMIHDGTIRLHEETDVLLSEYGVLKVTPKQYEELDKQYLLRVKKEANSYQCLTAQKRYYAENYPSYVLEKGSIDELLRLMLGGDEVEV